MLKSVSCAAWSWPLAIWLAAASAAQAPSWREAALAAVQEQVGRDRIPGLSWAVSDGRSEPWLGGMGLADVENDVPATAATVYRLASISKPITAVLAMQLVEAGQLDLDADVHGIVRGWPEKPWPVTTRQLLAHLGGVRHYRGEAESTVHFASQTEALPRFAADALLHQPGSKFHYSTYGFNLVAAVIEARTGKPFATVVRERIAVPLEAPSLQDDDVRRIIRGRAQGYVRVDGELRNSALLDASYKLGGGGLCGSAVDLLRFGQGLLGDQLLSVTARQRMWTRQRTTAGDEVEYGLGFGLDRDGESLVVSHSGAQSRVSTMFYLLPEARIVVVVLCNLERVRLKPLAQAIARLCAAEGK
jgi:CubicO group peptidase (beta-lactamase class C family)